MQTTNTKITIDVNGEEIPVYDKTKQAIFSRLKEKNRVQITGIVSRYKDELRLLPRGADDIKITQTAAAPGTESKSAAWKYIASTLAVGSLTAGIYIKRRKKLLIP